MTSMTLSQPTIDATKRALNSGNYGQGITVKGNTVTVHLISNVPIAEPAALARVCAA